MKPEESYLLRLTPIPGWSTPGIQRLRALLKAALRSFGLKAVELREEQPAAERAADIAAVVNSKRPGAWC